MLRQALARAVYARRSIAIFDDVFSALDSGTEKHVFKHVFGSTGLLKSIGTTVILATHSSNVLPFADHVVMLENGTIADQGSFEELNRPGGPLEHLELGSDRVEPLVERPPEGEREKYLPVTHADDVVAKSIDSETRRLGDGSVYKYYFKSIGTIHTVVFFLFQIAWVVLLKFPGKRNLCPAERSELI
jgi:ATP-binding cassette subfamily C (CFTR/MRP) protein 1